MRERIAARRRRSANVVVATAHVVVALLLSGTGESAGAAVRFVAVPLSSGPECIFVSAINNAGTIVGTQYFLSRCGGRGRVAVYESGAFRNLGTLGGAGSNGYAVNDAGQIVGTAETPTFDYHAFTSSGGPLQSLGPLPGAPWSTATAVNSAGQIAGCSGSSAGTAEQAFRYASGTMNALVAPGWPFGCASAIADNGDIAGVVYDGAGNRAAVVFSGTAATVLPLALGVATDINRHGEVVGHYRPTQEQRAFRFSAGVARDLGSLFEPGGAAAATGINDDGWIVGYSSPPSGNPPRAFVVIEDRMHDLNALVTSGLAAGHVLSTATAINDRGQIVAQVGLSFGPFVLYRLDPVALPEAAAAVPTTTLPATIALVVLVVIATALARPGRR
jgi:probable HAF family extracellular repeat protein